MMKTIKRLIYCLIGLLIAGCIGILVCALNPGLTAKLAELVQQGSPVEYQPQQSQGAAEGILVPETGGSNGVYQIPEEVQTVPGDVAGLTGVRPMTEDTEQITREEADNLSGILATGETGEGISFDAEFYPYYAMLDDTLKQIYKQVYANALELNTSFTPVASVTVRQAKNVVEAVYNDHPELFWLDAEFSAKYLETGICVEITLKYNAAADNLDAAKQDFTACAEEILSGTEEMENSFEKEQYIHDTLVRIVEYDMSAPMNQSAYSSLVLGRSVCAGYTRAFQYLLQQLGIPCYYCTGYAGEDHAWNIVKLGDIYRNVDVTWDDTNPSTYDYYNKSDSEYASTHKRTDLAVYLPACEDVVSDEPEETGSSAVDAYINPNPQEPLRWHSRGETVQEPEESSNEEDKRKENLEKAGITEDEVLDTLEEYYEDCGKQLVKEGTGQIQFTNVIPGELWNELEHAYSSGKHWKGYVDEALKELKAEYFVIQLQVQRLGGGYYRLYHNIYVE